MKIVSLFRFTTLAVFGAVAAAVIATPAESLATKPVVAAKYATTTAAGIKFFTATPAESLAAKTATDAKYATANKSYNTAAAERVTAVNRGNYLYAYVMENIGTIANTPGLDIYTLLAYQQYGEGRVSLGDIAMGGANDSMDYAQIQYSYAEAWRTEAPIDDALAIELFDGCTFSLETATTRYGDATTYYAQANATADNAEWYLNSFGFFP